MTKKRPPAQSRKFHVLTTVTRTECTEIEAANANATEARGFENGEPADNRGETTNVLAVDVEEVPSTWRPTLTPYTVIGLYDSSGEVFAESVDATGPHDAIGIVARRRHDTDVQIVAALEGNHAIVPPCEDSGKSASCADLTDNLAVNRGRRDLSQDISPIDLANALTPHWMRNIQAFDSLEIQPCAIIGYGDDGGEIVEPCAPADAAFWTVYGHYRPGGDRCGVDAFEDFATEAEARKFHDRLISIYPHLAGREG